MFAIGLALALPQPMGAWAQLSNRHRPDEDIVRMTPDQRVQEYCEEYARHSDGHSKYRHLLADLIMTDGSKAVPALTRFVNEFDPNDRKANNQRRDANCYAAEGLLYQMDQGRVRLRGISEGRIAIDAIKRLAERMKAAHFDREREETEYSRPLRYEGTLGGLRSLESINRYDHAIRDTLALRYNIDLSEDDILGFTNSLLSKDPYYPTWSEIELFKDRRKTNEGGYPLQYLIVKDIGLFYQAYLRYRTTTR
jgi:hypothetical protein